MKMSIVTLWISIVDVRWTRCQHLSFSFHESKKVHPPETNMARESHPFSIGKTSSIGFREGRRWVSWMFHPRCTVEEQGHGSWQKRPIWKASYGVCCLAIWAWASLFEGPPRNQKRNLEKVKKNVHFFQKIWLLNTGCFLNSICCGLHTWLRSGVLKTKALTLKMRTAHMEDNKLKDFNGRYAHNLVPKLEEWSEGICGSASIFDWKWDVCYFFGPAACRFLVSSFCLFGGCLRALAGLGCQCPGVAWPNGTAALYQAGRLGLHQGASWAENFAHTSRDGG